MKQAKRGALALLLCVCLLSFLHMPTSASQRFQDVPANHWAADAIGRAVNEGLFQGRQDGTFGLGENMTRASFVTALGRLFDWAPVTPALPTFTDVSRDAWCFSAVETACANGAVTRQSDEFRPNDPVTREDMAVMLVRALNYDTLAGLAQDLPLPFEDLTTNAGYVSVAYHLGLVAGVSTDRFAPEQPATREQSAVVLMRLLDQYAQQDMDLSAICGVNGFRASGDLDAVGINAHRLLCSGRSPLLNTNLDEGVSGTLKTELNGKGVPALWGVTGNSLSLRADRYETVKLLVKEVQAGGWDGIQLDIAQLASADSSLLTALVKDLRAALPDKLLYVVAEAPSWQSKSYAGYDFAALAPLVDQIILRVASYQETADGFPMAPPEPLEEVYYALCAVTEAAPADKVSLLLTTTGSLWLSEGSSYRFSSNVTATTIQMMLEKVESHYSNRYEAAYLMQGGDPKQAVWYLNDEAVEARVQLATLLGVHRMTLSDGGSVADFDGYSITSSLWGN